MLRDAHPAIQGLVSKASSIHILGAGLKAEGPRIERFTIWMARVGDSCPFTQTTLEEP